MIQNPREGELVARDPERAGEAIEEVLRLESPVQFARRVAARDFEHGGVRIARGEIAALLIGAANRDPARFHAPHEFRLGRDPAGGLSFGFGRHACLGQNLARIEAELTVATLLQEVPELLREPPVEFTWQLSPGFRGLARLDVDLS
jgi:cytochrome P450